ncbi:MAG: DUF262 domain-containing protein [Flavobacteriaceae bacterium]|nr:DUF262 domain-containing protein [Flavobacteriaceae bacterium]
MNDNTTSEKLTFLELISKHRIEIPIIQRDYAQGRNDKEELRKSFLTALLQAVNHKLLELDFVYGSVKKDKFQNTTLHPLDGQQRLTTLFLLHWFISIKENKLDNELKNILAKFTYETRTSSREFCIDLIEKGIVFDETRKISELIIDSSWFFLSWKRDPTIKSMLTMLEAIQQTFQNETDIFEKLNNISFHYIELQNFGLSDDLYIKMNARGKPLTDFENFKAKFEQYIKQKDWETDENPTEIFSYQIDTLWTDLFWNYRNDDNVFDDKFLNFFRTMAVINYTLKANLEDDDFRNNLDLLRGSQSISFNKYLELDCFDLDYFETLKTVLNKISDKKGLKTFLSETNYVNEHKTFNGAINKDLGYADLLKLFALYQYLACENNIDKTHLNDWMRIVRNLVEAHRLYFDNVNTFAESLLYLSKLFPHRNNIIEYFKDSSNPEDKGFPKFIIEEEITKAKLISLSEAWKKAITEIENHTYFNGQIGFLLDWCKDENGIHNFDKFIAYSEKSKAIFCEEGLIHFDNYLFERALLASGNYLLKKGQNHSFANSKGRDLRDIGWKRLLRDDNKQRKVLRLLFDKIKITNLVNDLNKIVDDFSDENDWRYYFIKYPEIISNCGSRKLIRYFDSNNILLLGSTMTSGFHKEYYSFSLFVELADKLSLDQNLYESRKSVEYWKYFELNDKQVAFCHREKKYVWTKNKDWENLRPFESREMAIKELSSKG